jgi:hypothetical protein
MEIIAMWKKQGENASLARETVDLSKRMDWLSTDHPVAPTARPDAFGRRVHPLNMVIWLSRRGNLLQADPIPGLNPRVLAG